MKMLRATTLLAVLAMTACGKKADPTPDAAAVTKAPETAKPATVAPTPTVEAKAEDAGNTTAPSAEDAAAPSEPGFCSFLCLHLSPCSCTPRRPVAVWPRTRSGTVAGPAHVTARAHHPPLLPLPDGAGAALAKGIPLLGAAHAAGSRCAPSCADLPLGPRSVLSFEEGSPHYSCRPLPKPTLPPVAPTHLLS